MKIVIKSTNIELTSALRSFIEEKINDLEKFAKVFQEEEYFGKFLGKGKPKVEAWVEIAKETKHHRKGKVFCAECQMRFPRRSIRATAESDDLRSAVVQVKDDLQRQLKQYKGKIAAKIKRGERKFKKELKISPAARLHRKGRIREEGM
jgi:ribosomal subunit interface protein